MADENQANDALTAEAEARIGPVPLERLKRQLRSAITGWPALYLPMRRRRRADSVAHDGTELILDGFPRCGNTWAEMALRHAATQPVEMAHHSHAAAHVIYGVRNRIPVLVLFRDPDDAVRSLLAMEERSLTARHAYREYVRFYRAVLALPKDRLSMASFADVTQRIEAVAAHLRDRHALPFASFDPQDSEQRQAIFARMDARAAEIRPDGEAVSRSNPGHYDAMQTALKAAAQRRIDALEGDRWRREAREIFARLESDIP